MAETVSLKQDGRRATISGRKRTSLQQKMNPTWWFMNSAEQTVDEAPWYRPAWPYWRRWLYWSLRNPLQNLRAFVLGVSDKNYNIIGRAPVMCVQRNDLLPPETGFQKVRAARRRPSGAPVLRKLQWETSCLVFRSSADRVLWV
jgi:hypothetical protein